ncbi:MAG: LPS export ABC transporter permease LptG [Sphingomonadales bacterium]|nr:LPS export ABC transporter permease LptG [Sphingomonadales bacterium]PIX65146.1 MAG: LPS export ABC transporter permease LptG [Sphingomonadales bacterium CG_4_10_14_3_um_filter_58_15]NCO49024.1 LPS export ABC transporter permease LptG [Sphingomonadales bacterium]NCP00835.1 LPS export ABC transporter permease LptG [Sphingomonadales bacterium]NCP26199.1 LPS export ABC transporter permease LptG [Sphingomonadales bacterium]
MDFFPSRTLAIYMAKMFIIRTLAVLALLVLVLQALDLLGESGKILAQAGNGEAELWTYVSLRAPQLVARFLPFSVLLGTIITLATLNQNSEVISMKAGGLSAHQILAPLIVASMGVALLSFVFNETLVAPATARLTQWEKVEYGPIPAESNIRTNVWVRDGNDLINARTVIGRGDTVRLQGVTIFNRTENELNSLMQGDEARFTGSGWLLTNVTRFDVSSGTEEKTPELLVGKTIRPDQFTLSNVDADSLSIFDLRSAIGELEQAGRPTMSLEAGWWHKISGPMSSILMPLLGAVAAFGLARSGQLFIRAVIGMALGFAYFVADNFALAMGNIGAYPALLAAWAPFLLFFLIGETVLIRTEE